MTFRRYNVLIKGHVLTQISTWTKIEIRGRPLDILGGGGGGGAWVIFQKKILSLVLKEKNNLSLKKEKKIICL